MLRKRIIPLIQVRGSSIVKTVQFQNPRIVGDAVSTIKVFSNRMADEMIITDIQATKKNFINFDLLKNLTRECVMPLTIGGGIKTEKDVEKLFRIGADKILINTQFYKDSNFIKKISKIYGNQSIVFSLDVMKNENSEFVPVSTSGLKKENLKIFDVVKKAVDCGFGEIILNVVTRDGMMNGFELDLIKKVSKLINIPLIAAGGCGQKEDFVLAIKNGSSAVAAGSIFYWVGESIISIKNFMHKSKINVRLI